MSSTIITREGTTVTVKLCVSLDLASSPEVREEIEPYLKDAQNLIFDFTDSDYISSAGLRLLLFAGKKVFSRDGNVRLIHVNEMVMNTLKLVNFTEQFDVEGNP